MVRIGGTGVLGALAASEAGAAVTFLVEVGEEWSVFVQQSSDAKTVHVHDDVAQVCQRL